MTITKHQPRFEMIRLISGKTPDNSREFACLMKC
ncbi:hypothetical protein HNQ37_001415 [Lactovum miscens]|uniref:Uncharacterized protein n=1 Tax=Lactovum miscens TaxID=190387 RepID=A0A841C838_9LACT|nr:hypothetical protein [Lactovum miscens]